MNCDTYSSVMMAEVARRRDPPLKANPDDDVCVRFGPFFGSGSMFRMAETTIWSLGRFWDCASRIVIYQQLLFIPVTSPSPPIESFLSSLMESFFMSFGLSGDL